jgi:hypothetical protein
MFLGEPIQMALDFLRQVGIRPMAAKESPHTRPQDPEPRHGSCSSSRLTIATVRAQLSVSTVSCFRPARVMA